MPHVVPPFPPLKRPATGYLPKWIGAALCAILLFTGCITIEEHYTFKKNGSGTMEYVVDMSEIADLMKALGEGGKGKKSKEVQDNPVTSGLDVRAAELKHLEGIKRVKMKEERDGFIQKVSFAFADVAALNRALNVLMPDSLGGAQEFFRWEGSTLVRVGGRYVEELGASLAQDPDSLNVGSMLASMKYKYSFAFAKGVAATQHAEGMILEEKKSRKLELGTDFSVITKDPHALDLRITLDQ